MPGPNGKFARSYLGVVAAVLVAAACDPNIVIGSKWSRTEGGSVSDAGTSPAIAGTGGASGTGGVAGQPPNDAGQSGDAAQAGAPALPEGGAGGAPTDDGTVWSADHENGSLSQWDEPLSDADAGGYYADGALPSYVTGHAHSGDGSAKVTIDTSVDTGAGQIARLYRRIQNGDASYSAWFNLAEDHTPSAWWSIFLFRAVKDRNASKDLWSINLARTKDDKLTLSLFDHFANKSIAAPAPAPIIPVGQWFQLEARLTQAYGQKSQLVIWLNGAEVFHLTDTTPPPDGQPLYWVIGNGGAKMTPAISTVYVDDAQVSTDLLAP